jgi:hypothetical protein
MTEKQTVANETETQPASSGEEGVDARTKGSELDRILSEIGVGEEPEPGSTDQGKEPTKDDLKSVVQFVKGEQERAIAERVQADVNQAVKVAKGDLDIDDEEISDLLYGRASRDARFAKAWAQRGDKPEQWDTALKAFNKDLAARQEARGSQDLKDDREAVLAHVRGESTTAGSRTFPSESEIMAMSQKDFDALQRKYA